MKKLLIYIMLASSLAACAGTPATRYYQLPDSAFHAPMPRGTEVAVQVVLAEHLQGENLLYQTDDYHLNFAQNNLWATPLDDALAANLSNKLNQVSRNQTFVPQHLAKNGAAVLKIYIDRFQGTYRGETEISGYAQFGGDTRLAFNVNTPQQGDGYDAMISSLNNGLETVARQIGR